MKTNAHVYVMHSPTLGFKVGHATALERRRRQLEWERSVPVCVEYKTSVLEAAERIERLAHRLLRLANVPQSGNSEWFDTSLEEAVSAIERAIRIVSGQEAMPDFPRPKSEPSGAPFSMRMDADLKAELQKLALAENRSLTNYVDTVLREHVAEREKREGKRK